jgi:hypothetical protein
MKLAIALAAAALPAAALAQVPPKMEAPQAVIFMAKPGDVLTVGDTKWKDGDKIVYIADDAEIGTGQDAVATIAKTKGGATTSVPNPHVLTEERLKRSPDGNWAVFSALRACADFCYADVWLIGQKARLKITGEAGPDVTVAFSADGKQASIGGRALHVVDLATVKSAEHSTVTSPSYAPDGTLWARGIANDDAAYTLVDGTWKRVVKLAGKSPSPEPGADPGDPTPVRFEGEVLIVEFDRGNYTHEVRATRAGKILKKKKL